MDRIDKIVLKKQLKNYEEINNMIIKKIERYTFHIIRGLDFVKYESDSHFKDAEILDWCFRRSRELFDVMMEYHNRKIELDEAFIGQQDKICLTKEGKFIFESEKENFIKR